VGIAKKTNRTRKWKNSVGQSPEESKKKNEKGGGEGLVLTAEGKGGLLERKKGDEKHGEFGWGAFQRSP